MSRYRRLLLSVVVSPLAIGVVALLLLATPAAAQDQGGDEGSAESAEPMDQGEEYDPGEYDDSLDVEAPGLGAEPQGLGDIDEILEGEEEVLGGGGYTYDPGERRDPFKSLLAARDRPELRGPRPAGVPGLLIDELKLSGIFETVRGWVAQVQAGKSQRSYLLKEGDQLYDGDVVSIAQNEVVFKQIVQDPTALKPFREVVKKLNP